MSLPGCAVPRACEPKILSSAIPYLPQMAARRASSTSAPAMISTSQGYPEVRWSAFACERNGATGGGQAGPSGDTAEARCHCR